MNRILKISTAVFIAAFICASVFTQKADRAIAAVPQALKNYQAARDRYVAQRIKVDSLKEKKDRNFFDIMNIKFALSRGSALSARVSREKQKYDEVYEDAFTYAAVALEELTQEFMNAKGEKKAGLFRARQKYAMFVIQQGILKMDEKLDIPVIAGSRDALADIKAYREKRKTQAQQRLLIAREELEVIKEAKKNGIHVDAGYEGMVVKAVKDLKD